MSQLELSTHDLGASGPAVAESLINHFFLPGLSTHKEQVSLVCNAALAHFLISFKCVTII